LSKQEQEKEQLCKCVHYSCDQVGQPNNNQTSKSNQVEPLGAIDKFINANPAILFFASIVVTVLLFTYYTYKDEKNKS